MKIEDVNIATDKIVEMFRYNLLINGGVKEFVVIFGKNVVGVNVEVVEEFKCEQKFQKVIFNYDGGEFKVYRRVEDVGCEVEIEASDFMFKSSVDVELYLQFGKDAKSWEELR